MKNSEFEKLIMRSTTERNYTKVIDFLEKESTSTDKFMITNGISTKGTFYYNKTRVSKSKASAAGDYGDMESTGSRFSKTKSSIYKKSSATGYGKTNFELISTDVQEKFQEIIGMFQETDWKKRVSALKSLSNFIQEEEKLINKSKKFFQIIDVMVQCLKDNNTKVVTAAQDIFTNVMPQIRVMIEKGSSLVIEGLAANIVSSNVMIKN